MSEKNIPRAPRHRFLTSLVVGVIVALLAGAATVLLHLWIDVPVYRCTGTVHILPVIKSLLFDKDGTMPMYDSFVQTQVVMLKSERCLDMAMSSPRWLNEGKRTNSEDVGRWFAQHLDVTRAGEIIRVSFTDPDPKTDGDAVAAVIDSYQVLTADLDPDQPRKKQLQLEQFKTDYETKIADAQKEIQVLSGPFDPDVLRARLPSKVAQLNDAEVEWHKAQDAIAERPGSPDMKTHERTTHERFLAAEKDVAELSHQLKTIKDLENRMAPWITWLGETKQKLEELRVAAAATGRIEIISNGDRPVLLPTTAQSQTLTVAGVAFLIGFLGSLSAGRRKR